MGGSSNDSKPTGTDVEQAAEQWLQQQGLHIVARNFRCRGGEIDLIMRDDDDLVFIEVRLRSHSGFGSAAESVTPRKRQRLVHAARYFLACHPQWLERASRFDVIGTSDGKRWQWLRNAFDAGDRG